METSLTIVLSMGPEQYLQFVPDEYRISNIHSQRISLSYLKNQPQEPQTGPLPDLSPEDVPDDQRWFRGLEKSDSHLPQCSYRDYLKDRLATEISRLNSNLYLGQGLEVTLLSSFDETLRYFRRDPARADLWIVPPELSGKSGEKLISEVKPFSETHLDIVLLYTGEMPPRYTDSRFLHISGISVIVPLGFETETIAGREIELVKKKDGLRQTAERENMTEQRERYFLRI